MSAKVRLANAYGRRLVRAAKDMGFTWRFGGSGHIILAGHGVEITAPGTPRNPDEALKQTLSRLRRAAGVAHGARP